LENEKRGYGMLSEQLEKSRNGNIKSVVAIMLLDPGKLGAGGNTSRSLEMFEEGFWLCINRICEGRERVLRCIIEESALLE
jgi:hypothetical protein